MINEIENWVLNVLSKPNKVFNNLPPCPYAKKAWVEGRVQVIGDYFEDFEALLRDESDLYIMTFNDDVSKEEFYEEIDYMRERLGNDYIILDDHPDEIEEVDGFNLNFGKPVAFIQSRQKLTEHREELKKTKYYDNWTEEYKRDVWEL